MFSKGYTEIHFLWLDKAISMAYTYLQERIMRKEERGEERDTTTHLIKIQILPMLDV